MSNRSGQSRQDPPGFAGEGGSPIYVPADGVFERLTTGHNEVLFASVVRGESAMAVLLGTALPAAPVQPWFWCFDTTGLMYDRPIARNTIELYTAYRVPGLTVPNRANLAGFRYQGHDYAIGLPHHQRPQRLQENLPLAVLRAICAAFPPVLV